MSHDCEEKEATHISEDKTISNDVFFKKARKLYPHAMHYTSDAERWHIIAEIRQDKLNAIWNLVGK